MHKLNVSEYSSQLDSASSTLVSVGLAVGVSVVGDGVGRSVGTDVGICVGLNEGSFAVEGAAPFCSTFPGPSLAAAFDDGNSSASDSNVDDDDADDDDDVLLSSELLRFSDSGTAIATMIMARRDASPAAMRHRRDAILQSAWTACSCLLAKKAARQNE